MTYFQHTKRDLAEAKQEIGEAIAALAEDTARKMNGATAQDEDAEFEYDRTYLLEDLLSRMMLIAEAAGVKDLSGLFPAAYDGQRVTMAYDLLTGEEDATVTDMLGSTRYVGTAKPLVISDDTIREAWELQTFDGGYPRHEHEGYPDARCSAMLRSTTLDRIPVSCGRYYGHEIHKTEWPGRGKS